MKFISFFLLLLILLTQYLKTETKNPHCPIQGHEDQHLYFRLRTVCVCVCVCVCTRVRACGRLRTRAFSLSVMSSSLKPRGLQLTMLLCPWDFPSKNTAVGCHFHLQGIFPNQQSNPYLLLGRQILYHCATWETYNYCQRLILSLLFTWEYHIFPIFEE